MSVFRFGPFEFDAAGGELRRDGKKQRLEPQPARALALLVDRSGAVVTRDELRQHLWGDQVHVDFDRGLAYAIGQVRSALGDSAEHPRFIETLPRRGFRLLVPVTAVDSAAAAARSRRAPLGIPWVGWWAAGAALVLSAFLGSIWGSGAGTSASSDRVAVAVAVFDNETGLEAYDVFVAGLADVVVANLVERAGDRLGVIGNEAILRRPRDQRDLKTIQRETGAEYVVLGQFQNDPAGVRLLAHLIRLDDGSHVWAERFIRPADAIGDLDRDVGIGVADAVISQLLAPARP